MKFLIKIIFSLSIISPLFANSLVCERDEGIEKCKREANSFCSGMQFSLKVSSNSYIVTCKEGLEQKNLEVNSNNNSSLSNQENENENVKSDNDNDSDSLKYTDKSSQPFIKFAIGLGLNGEGTADSDLIITDLNDSSQYRGSAVFKVSSSMNLSVEGRYLQQNGWGAIVGADVDFSRDVESGSITLGGNTVRFSDSGQTDTLSTFIFHGSLAYKWNQFYIPFGLNISFIDYEAVGLSVNSTPTVGAQLGIGYELDTNFAFELHSRALGYKLDYIDDNLDIYFDEGVMTNILFKIKYIFN